MKEKLSQLYLATFKDLDTATSNCLNDFKHQHGESEEMGGEVGDNVRN